MVDIYGNKLHHNDGTHLDGGMADNYLWQRFWQRPASQLSIWCATPSGDVLNFMALLKEVFFISDIHIQKSKVFLKELKDNHSFITVAQYNKISLEKKTAIRYQHFRSFTQKKNYFYLGHWHYGTNGRNFYQTNLRHVIYLSCNKPL